MPVSCSELRVQVGAVKLHGLSQLMLLAAAAAEARPMPHGSPPSAGGAARGVEQGGAASSAPAHRPLSSRHRQPPAGRVLQAVAWMPEKVSVQRPDCGSSTGQQARVAALGSSGDAVSLHPEQQP